jgi:hypothetical protein
MTAPAVPDAGAPRLDRLLPVGIGAAVLLVALLTVTPWPVGAFQDDAIYAMLGKALATGEGYRMINLPGSPHATHYPPGYPAFLAVLWRIAPSFPDNIVLFKFANAAWLSVAALGAYRFALRRLDWSPWLAAGASVAGTLAIVVLLVTGVVLSEPMFMALLFPALLSSERAVQEGSIKWAIIAGAACGILALVRTLGAVIVPAACCVLVLRRQWKPAIALAATAAAFLVPWQLWLSAWQHEIPPVLQGKYGAYGPWMAQGFREGGLPFARDVAVTNLQSIDRFLSYALMPVTAVLPRAIAFVSASVLTVMGILVLVRRAPVSAVFLAGYAVVVLTWPFEPDRFVLAIWPLLTLCFVAGGVWIYRWRPAPVVARGVRIAVLAAAAMVSAGFTWYNARGYGNQWWASVQRDAGRRAKPVVEWVAASTSPDDVLMTDDDLLVYLYTGRRGMPTSTFLPRERVRPLTDEENADAVRQMIDLYAPRYYITTSEPGRRAAESLTTGEHPMLRRYRLIPNAFVYERIVPDTTP